MADLIATTGVEHSSAAAVHPLDPLTVRELRAVVDAVRRARSLDARHLFVTVQLDEPPKGDVVAWREGDMLDRAARVAVWDRGARTLWEGVVSVSGHIRSWHEVPGVMAPGLGPEVIEAAEAARADQRLRDALEHRGIDADSVYLEPWPFGGLVPDTVSSHRRLVWVPMWERHTPDDNPYAHPIHGLFAIIDLDTGEVIDVEDHGARPIPQEDGHYRLSQLPPPRPDLKEIKVTQPNGPSFVVDGWQVRWQKWSFRIGFCPREGLVIHDVRYDDTATQRRIAHRMSIAELVIPYGDPDPGSYRKNAFDVGEGGMGLLTNSLELGCDCLGEIRYLDVAVADRDGTVRTIKNGICLHEEDHGILWKHTDPDGHVEVRRSRRFVASSIVTVDNYEYGYFWYFYQDGSIEFEAKLTGVVLTLAADPDTPPRYATEIAPGLLAPYHQHIFCARLDLDVDGQPNSVIEVDAVAPPRGSENPYGGAFVASQTTLSRESEAKRLVDPAHSRYWKVTNPRRTNRLGQPVAYKLAPGHTTYPLALSDSSIGRRAAFMYHHLWVTQYRAEERYPAGDYPFQHPGGSGLPEWTTNDRSTTNTDIVLWYVFGSCHIPRPEDWPVMPVVRVGFHLEPLGFFDRNPALDVPPTLGPCADRDGQL
jgi:primary-amine oxidase